MKEKELRFIPAKQNFKFFSPCEGYITNCYPTTRFKWKSLVGTWKLRTNSCSWGPKPINAHGDKHWINKWKHKTKNQRKNTLQAQCELMSIFHLSGRKRLPNTFRGGWVLFWGYHYWRTARQGLKDQRYWRAREEQQKGCERKCKHITCTYIWINS